MASLTGFEPVMSLGQTAGPRRDKRWPVETAAIEPCGTQTLTRWWCTTSVSTPGKSASYRSVPGPSRARPAGWSLPQSWRHFLDEHSNRAARSKQQTYPNAPFSNLRGQLAFSDRVVPSLT